MTTIKLRLGDGENTFAQVAALPGLAGLELDTRFGLICLAPHERLYAVRTADPIPDMARRRVLSPEIVQEYGDVQVSG